MIPVNPLFSVASIVCDQSRQWRPVFAPLNRRAWSSICGLIVWFRLGGRLKISNILLAGLAQGAANFIR
jgi:hypothetical protein